MEEVTDNTGGAAVNDTLMTAVATQAEELVAVKEYEVLVVGFTTIELLVAPVLQE